MAHTFWNGFSGTVLVGAFTLDITEWSGDVETEVLDTTNTSNYDSGTALGWQSNINGVSKMSGSVKTYFDSLNIPTGATAGIKNGASVTLTLNIGGTGKTIICPARISKISVGNNVKQVISFEFSYESNGVVTLPT